MLRELYFSATYRDVIDVVFLHSLWAIMPHVAILQVRI